MAKKGYVWDGTAWQDLASSVTDLSNYYTKSQSDAIVPPGAWTSYTPTLSNGWSNGNGTWTAYYTQIGKTVHVRAYFVLGSTTTKGTGMDVSLPVTGLDTIGMLANGYMSIGGTLYAALVSMSSSSNARVYVSTASTTYTTFTNVTSAIPGTWATGDWVRIQFTYEAA